LLAVGFALASAFLFGAMTVALRFALARTADAELGALVTTATAFGVALLALPFGSGPEGGGGFSSLGFFALAGLLAPGGSQVLFTRAVRDAGPSRTSVVVGSAPLFAAAIAVVFLGEPLRVPLAVGAVLIVVAGIFLAGERRRPEHVKLVGILIALAATLLFSTRDNLVRWYAADAGVGSIAAAAAALGAAALGMLAYALATRRRQLGVAVRGFPAARFALAGILFGLSYVFLFEAYYRGRVTVVSPLVATESLWGVVLTAMLLRRTEAVGPRIALGACFVAAGGILIGTYR
jgi:drug/metabolite transporter (DMT)-like permease